MSNDLGDRVVENFRAFIPLVRHLRGAQVAERLGVVTWTSDVHLPLFNGIWGMPEASDLDAAIDDLLAPYDEGNIPLLWVVPPPHEIDLQLDARGFTLAHTPGMALELAALREATPGDGVEVVEVDGDRSLLEQAARIAFSTNGFGADAGSDWADLLDAIPQRRAMRTFLATVDGVPAASGTLFETGSTAGLYNVGTLPEYRRRGLGALVSTAALAAGRDDGYPLGALFATPDGEPVYRRIGFREVCRITFAIRASPSP